MKKIRKMTAILLAAVMVILMIPVATVTVSAGSVIESAISWAVDIANDDTHLYSQSVRWGPSYDCSSLVISAFQNAGVDTGSASWTGNMKSEFTKHGFDWISWSDIGDVSNLQRGDVLLYHNDSTRDGHTEIYLGNNTNVGAHSANRPASDQISVSGYYYHPWQGVLRYKDEQIHNPIGSWDSISSGGLRRIRVTGWAYDPDDTNASLDIHVYVGGPAGSGAPCYVIKADVYRADINIGNCRHGFDSYIDVSPTGYQNVYLYAINVGEGYYTELGVKAIDISGEIASFGYDYPTDNQEISDRSFLFQGWVQPNKEISSITCSINDGEKYFTSNLYSRPDVPNATAFRTDIATSNLKVGNNKIAVCVNFTDGTGVVAGVRTVNRTRPEIIAALDCPETDCHIETDKFLCQGWVDSDKEVDSITIRVNNGIYYPLNLYKREDVPYATAFRRDLSSEILTYGKNAIALCVNFKDGTGAVPIIREFYKDYAIALDNPIDNEIITTERFLFQGWVASSKTVKSIICKINDETIINTGLYKREDVPFADAFRAEIRSEYLNVGSNQIQAVVEYTDGTTVSSITRTIYLKSEIGDTNLDGNITISDVTAIQRHLAELELFSDEQIALADTNGDGKVDITDATHLQKYLAEFDGIALGKQA